MIKVKLNVLAEKLNKSITDIAAETGLNRNTITALYHNKVDGIKFDTLQKICDVYKIKIEDVLSFDTTTTPQRDSARGVFKHPYKQEGDGIIFTLFPPFFQSQYPTKEYFPASLGNLFVFCKKEYGMFYWERNKMDAAAEEIFAKLNASPNLAKVYGEFEKSAAVLKTLYKKHSDAEILGYSEKQIIEFAQTVWKAYEPFWQHSIFIDVFDAGYDVQKIEEIKKKHEFTDAEVSTLTTSEKLTYGNERLLRLTEIAKSLRGKKYTAQKLTQFVKESPLVTEYIRDFNYYKSNYAFVFEITHDEVVKELSHFINDAHFDDEYKKLSTYTTTVKKAVEAVLKKHKLRENPFAFFQTLIYWREYRKQVNLMGIHLLHALLRAIEIKTGIPYKYLKHLTFDEIPNVLKGLVSRDQMQKRFEKGVAILTVDGQYKLIEGEEAQSLNDEFEKNVSGGTGDQKIIYGKVACQGYAKGIARVIYGQADFDRFKEGEILVTGMTRPEFVPLMKKAAAIVTNEGGITCHAAIVSRELNKPCIIGTQRATQIIKDGDLVEVRANHGTVRVLTA